MDKELRGIVMEILFLGIFILVVVPVCVFACDNYQNKKNEVLQGSETIVDISNHGDMKKISVSSKSGKKVYVRLILEISDFRDVYLVYLNDQVFDLDHLNYSLDDENRHYDLGVYMLDSQKDFLFQLSNIHKNYDDMISYRFYTESIV